MKGSFVLRGLFFFKILVIRGCFVWIFFVVFFWLKGVVIGFFFIVFDSKFLRREGFVVFLNIVLDVLYCVVLFLGIRGDF